MSSSKFTKVLKITSNDSRKWLIIQYVGKRDEVRP